MMTAGVAQKRNSRRIKIRGTRQVQAATILSIHASRCYTGHSMPDPCACPPGQRSLAAKERTSASYGSPSGDPA